MNEIFQEIFNRLTAQIGGNIYDHVPKNLATNNYPFIRIDPVQTSNNDTDTESGFSATIQIVGYSKYRGVKEINDLADNIYTALHRYAFPDTITYGVSGIHESFRKIAKQPDGLTRNSVQQFTIIFEPLPLP